MGDEDEGHIESVEIKNSTFNKKKVTNGTSDKGKNNESPTIISLLENDTMINNNYNNNDDDNNMNVTSNMNVNDNNENQTVISQSDSSNEKKDNSILPPPTPIYELYDGYDFPKHSYSPYGFCGALTKYLRKTMVLVTLVHLLLVLNLF